MKKFISVLLSVATIATMSVGLTSCGSGAKTGGTLTWYTFGDRPDDLDAVLEKANEIIEPEIGMKLDMQYIDSASYKDQMKLKMASGDKYDLAFTGYNNPYQTAVELGGLYDITDLIKEVGLDLPQFYLDAATVDGKIYGIPNVQVVSNPVCFEVDKSLVEKLGIDMNAIQEAACNAKTMDDIKAYAALLDDMFAKIHEACPDKYVFNPTYNVFMEPIYEEVEGTNLVIRKDGTSNEIVSKFDTEEWAYSVEKIREWYQKGYIRQDIASAGNAVASNEEKQQIAVRVYTWKPGQEPLDTDTYGQEQAYAFLHKPYVKRTGALATMTSVGANSDHPKEAVELLKMVNSNVELYNIICWGIEGKHYTRDEEGFVTEIPNSGYNEIGKFAWKFGNQFNAYLVKGQEPNVWEETEKMNNEAIKSPMLGFVVKTEDVATEIGNVINVSSEYGAKKDFGTADSSTYMSEFKSKLEQAGMPKIVDSINTQYQEFLANK